MSNPPYCEQCTLWFTQDTVVKFGVKDEMNILNQLKKTQNKAIRILNFKGPREGAENLYIQRIKNR